MSLRSNEGLVLDVVDRIYEASEDASLWNVALAEMADLLGADDAALGIASNGQIPWLASPRTDPNFLERYPDYQHEDIVWQRIVAGGVGCVSTDQMVSNPDELARNAFHHEWSLPQGYRHKMGALVLEEPHCTAVLIVPNRSAFDRHQTVMLEQLLPHLRRAIRFGIAFSRQKHGETAIAELLEASPRAALIADCAGRVLHANAAAEKWFEQGARLVDGRLPIPANLLLASEHVELSAGLRVTISLLRPPSALPIPGVPAMLLNAATSVHEDQVGALRQRFHLTEAEALLAIEIMRGDGRKAAAERRGIADTTARTHLTRIFEKTGVSRQAALVRLLTDTDG